MSGLTPKTHRFLLFMTVFMGVLILLGFGFLAYVIASRAGNIASEMIVGGAVSQADRSLPLAASLPEGAIVQQIATDAGRLVIWYRLGPVDDRILILDLADAAALAEITSGSTTAPAPSPAPGQIAPPPAE